MAEAKKTETRITETRITHVMSDGTVRNSIEGVMIPKGHPAYNILCNAYQKMIDHAGLSTEKVVV